MPSLIIPYPGNPNYEAIASLIFNTVLNGSCKGRTYNELGRFVDKYVNRLTGSQSLEESIEYMMDKMKEDGLVNVRGETVVVPHWIRGEESAVVIEPINKKLNMLGLGGSGGTPPAGFSAQVVLVQSLQDLDDKSNLIAGKMVVFNQGWLGSYGNTTVYRGDGPSRAARYGAVAALVESVTPYSLATPHTGYTYFGVNDTAIPAASITREDAELLSRLYNRGENISIHLRILDEVVEPVNSRNAFGEIVGREYPDEIVGVSGHMDAWDVGQGAMDDAGGVMISVEALALIKSLGLVLQRTLQAILCTAEEFGILGVQSFVDQHKSELGKYNAVFESDHGAFKPRGLHFAGSDEAGVIYLKMI